MDRRLLLGILLLVMQACSPGQPDFGYAKSNDPFYSALTAARENLSNMAEYRGRPAQAARALGQFEFITAELQDKPDLVVLPASVQPQLDSGQQELRTTLGIASGTPPRQVAAALNRFATALEAGQRQDAMHALAQPFFTRGPEGTFDALDNLPPMPAVETAASSLALGPPGASEAVMHQRLHRRRLQSGSMSNWSR
jgi:hypothetical protein